MLRAGRDLIVSIMKTSKKKKRGQAFACDVCVNVEDNNTKCYVHKVPPLENPTKNESPKKATKTKIIQKYKKNKRKKASNYNKTCRSQQSVCNSHHKRRIKRRIKKMIWCSR